MLMLGLILSQWLPMEMGEHYATFREVIMLLLGICLAFIMINVGREFEVDRSNLKPYAIDYLVAMASAAAPWLLIAAYYIFVLLPCEQWGNSAAWRETLLLSRFSAPTSAGILFAMLAALGLQQRWIYRKIQILAIFDDLDTILLMIPLQVAMIGMRWQMGVILLVVVALLIFGWRKMSAFNIRQDWKAVLLYATLIYGSTIAVYYGSKHLWGIDSAIHLEVLLPAFVLGMVIKNKHIDTPQQERATTTISLLFMLLVGMSMPTIVSKDIAPAFAGVISSIEMPSWGVIALHVIAVSILSNVGKLVPMLFYRNHSLRERLALSIGMFTRGEVGAGVIFIALGYNIGGPVLLISVLTLVLNLILTIGFVLAVKRLALKEYNN